jgi:TatD DNase family protein
VLQSFTESKIDLERALDRGLYIGVNGISTFTKDEAQQAMFDTIPLDRFLLETDAPFLTPKPFRGKINEPALVREVAAFHAERRNLELLEVAEKTSENARKLFAI